MTKDTEEVKEPEKRITSVYLTTETMEWLEEVKKRTGRTSISNVIDYICLSLCKVEKNERRPITWLK